MKQEILDRLRGNSLQAEEIKFIDSGCYALNRIISGKYEYGIPIGAIVQFQGESSSGKSLFATTILASAQKQGCYTHLIDSENTFSKSFGESLGIDTNSLVYSTAETLEEAFDQANKTIVDIRSLDKTTPIVIAIDSVAVLPTKEEMEREALGDIKATDGARRAIVFGSLLRKFNHSLRKNNTTLIVINQIRTDIGVMYGNPNRAAAGGKSLEFYLSVNIETISNKTSDVIRDDNKKPLGIVGRLRCKKNKVGLPFQECDFKAVFNKGLDRFYGLESMLADDNLITRSDSGRLSVGEIKFKKGSFSDLLLDFTQSNAELDNIRSMLGINTKAGNSNVQSSE